MPLTRYYILENDTTTAGGIIQKTTNPIVFNVDGKKQSCIGDDVWCSACQSMGKIVPTGPRLSFSLGGAMPALNDDLCLCKCTPPPKLVHSQTSFKEIIDDNRLAQYRQAQAQYRQAKLQNNLTSTKTNDELPNFTVHFRRPDDYQGGYGFDWLRDEYIHPLVEVNGKSQRLFQGDTKRLINEYQKFKSQSIKELNGVDSLSYTPAWLTLFASTSPVGVSQVSLKLRIDSDETNPQPLTDNGITLSFECSQGLQVTTPTLSLGQALSQMTKQQIHFDDTILIQEGNKYSSKQESKTLIYHQSQNPIITITCTQSFKEIGYIKAFAQKGNTKKQVGLLCVYPNNKIKKAVIQPTFIVTIPNISITTHPMNYKTDIQKHLLSQALIQADVLEPISFNLIDKIIYIGNDKQSIPISHHKKIDKFLQQYPQIKDVNNQYGSYEYDSKQLMQELVGLHRLLLSGIKEYADSKNYQKHTHLIFSDYAIAGFDSQLAGIAQKHEVIDDYNACQTDRVCNHWGNVCVLFNQSDIHTLIHELGHSFGLSHTFRDETGLRFSWGYTDNIMDYEHTENGDINPYKGTQWSLFKHHWDIMNNDNNLE